ncbi:hypothetical protein SJI19_03225 [Acerihabitans sp. TG2]|nr:hypothetical protein [Acerihabitans sp. TG2]MEA9389573.1 hypothetical protein [Acerihabitans sp. TG2]
MKHVLNNGWHSAITKIVVSPHALRAMGDIDAVFFEKNWPDYLTKAIYQ